MVCNQPIEHTNIEIVSRSDWNAKPPKAVENMTNPVPFVVIHHSYIPAACETKDDCIKAMQSMQEFHQGDRGWNDIGYSFAVGSDGRAYEGRGWSTVGAHAPRYNNKSIGICVIGDWMEKIPPKNQLDTVKNLIDYGVQEGKIIKNYTLIGHRQVRKTECPGTKFYNEISTWPHYSELPITEVYDPNENKI